MVKQSTIRALTLAIGLLMGAGACNAILGMDEMEGLEDDDDNTSCDNKGDCQACTQCAIQGKCASQRQTCQNNAQCLALDNCAGLCADTTCVQYCIASYPDGANDYSYLLTCIVCTACYVDCSGANSC